jgi:hypothetical protein
MDKYFARCTLWDWHNGSQIDIVDIEGHVLATLDDKFQTWIFNEADGGRTVRNMLAWMAAHYREGNPKPPNLEAELLKSLAVLVDDLHVIKLSDKGPVLPDYLLSPWSEQDHGEAERLMKADGYIR